MASVKPYTKQIDHHLNDKAKEKPREDKKHPTFIREWEIAIFMTSVFTFSYSPTSSFVTTDLALLRAKEASLGRVGPFSVGLLDDGALGISITSITTLEPGLEEKASELEEDEGLSRPPPSWTTNLFSASSPKSMEPRPAGSSFSSVSPC
jgi:hypothetical protein